MTDDFNAFFDDGVPWDDHGEAPASGDMPPVPPKSRKEMRKRRNRHKRKTVGRILIVAVVVALLVGGGYVGVNRLVAWRDAYNEATAASAIEDYPGPGDDDVSFTVNNGQGANEIAQALAKADIIKSAAAFTSVVMANKTTLYPGTFALKTHMKASDVVAVLSQSSNASGFLEVRAGERVDAIIDAAAKVSGISRSTFDAIISKGGKGILPDEAGGSFEGWLEPGTYDVKSMDNAQEVLKALVDARIAKLDDLGVPSGDERERVLTVASIAEAEVNRSDYYGKVTRVIDNRLEQDMTLGMDSTVAYGNGVAPSKITQDMLDDANNPYNTRQRKGLPPTPISNPGDNAIKAALHPEEGDWLFFVTINLNTGETKFTTGSIDEQNAQFEELVDRLHQWEADNQ